MSTQCAIPGCHRSPEHGLNVCAPCYFRNAPPRPRVPRRRENPPRMTPDERFTSYISVPADPAACHEWTGGRDSHGYGIARIGSVLVRAHRYAWARVNGPIPAGMVICHRCDNPPCVNLNHLWLGTQRDNIRDAQDKGRFPIAAPS